MNGENEESKVLISKSILTGVAATIREREHEYLSTGCAGFFRDDYK